MDIIRTKAQIGGFFVTDIIVIFALGEFIRAISPIKRTMTYPIAFSVLSHLQHPEKTIIDVIIESTTSSMITVPTKSPDEEQ